MHEVCLMKQKVLVAMSGGVDSSVAASLLRDEGYEVIGITMRLFTDLYASPKAGERVRGPDNVRDAQIIAKELNIPHHELDLQKQFSELIIDDFVETYRTGKTPNPCIRCNRFIKFGKLLDITDELGADFIATGHYARIEYDTEHDEYRLKKAVDESKDQSYFLYVLKQRQLGRILMPLGVRYKEKVREIAQQRNLHVHEKSESQEICFIDGKDYRRFFEQLDPELLKPGSIRDQSGRQLGTHSGIAYYTIGQRRGLGISYSEPLYVTRIDRSRNTIYVGTRKEVYHRELVAHEVNWIGNQIPEEPLLVQVKVRSIHSPATGMLHLQKDGRATVTFDEPQWAVTPGQAAVFYLGDTVLGGGTILEGR